MNESHKDEKVSLLKLAGEIARRVQICDVRLVESRMKRGIFSHSEIPEEAHLESGFKVKDCFDPDSKRLDALITFFLRAKSNDDDVKHVIFRIEASFSIEYVVADDASPTDDEVKAFSRLNGIYNAWPYWREYVQSIVCRMGLPPLTLPVLTPGSIEKMVRDYDENTSDESSESDAAATG